MISSATVPHLMPVPVSYADFESFNGVAPGFDKMMPDNLPPDFDAMMDQDLMDPSLLAYEGFGQDFTAPAVQQPEVTTASAPPPLKAVASMPNIKSSDISTPQKENAPNTRKRIPPEKTLILESSFQENPKPDREWRDALARETGLPVRNIQVSSSLPPPGY